MLHALTKSNWTDNTMPVSSATDYLPGKLGLGQSMLVQMFCRVFFDKLVVVFQATYIKVWNVSRINTRGSLGGLTCFLKKKINKFLLSSNRMCVRFHLNIPLDSCEFVKKDSRYIQQWHMYFNSIRLIWNATN